MDNPEYNDDEKIPLIPDDDDFPPPPWEPPPGEGVNHECQKRHQEVKSHAYQRN